MKKLLLTCMVALAVAACKKDEEPTHTYTVEASINLIDSTVNRDIELSIKGQIFSKYKLPTLKRPTSIPPATYDSTLYYTYTYTGTYPAYTYVKTFVLHNWEKLRLKNFEDGILVREDSIVAGNNALLNSTIEFYTENYGR